MTPGSDPAPDDYPRRGATSVSATDRCYGAETAGCQSLFSPLLDINAEFITGMVRCQLLDSPDILCQRFCAFPPCTSTWVSTSRQLEIGGLRLPPDCVLPSPDWPPLYPARGAPPVVVGFRAPTRGALIQAAVGSALFRVAPSSLVVAWHVSRSLSLF